MQSGVLPRPVLIRVRQQRRQHGRGSPSRLHRSQLVRPLKAYVAAVCAIQKTEGPAIEAVEKVIKELGINPGHLLPGPIPGLKHRDHLA